MTEIIIDESFKIARQIRSDRSWSARLVRYYWRLCFRLTMYLEKFIKSNSRVLAAKGVMNYGCGNKFYEQAINVDLFAPHRFIRGKRRPDLYWSGTIPAPGLFGRLDGIVCEHVIEHILPDNVLGLLKNFRGALKDTGVLVISFPDVAKVLSGSLCQGYTTTAATLNSVIYRHGHCFMYDTQLVTELLKSVGFEHVFVAKYDEVPLIEFIGPGRVAESSYVVAKCSKSPDLY